MEPRDDAPDQHDPTAPVPSAPGRGPDGPPTEPSPGPVQVVVRRPADLLACVTLALGFVPERSVVLLSLPPGRGPHARVDLVTDLDDAPAMAQALVRPALRHAVSRVALVVLDDLERGAAVAPVLEDAFEAAEIEVVALVAADGTHWLSLLRGQRTTVPREYDALSHPFVADAVLRGQVVLASRRAVRASLEPDPAFVRAVQQAGCSSRPRAVAGGGHPAWDAGWVRRTLEQHVRAGSAPTARDVADLLTALDDPACRDAAWAWAERADARTHVDLWLRVVRGCPDERVGPAAAVLAFHAWLAGDGALAWCALDRGRRGRKVSLAALVGDLLEAAASPDLWTPQLLPDPPRPGTAGRAAPAPRSAGGHPSGPDLAAVVDLASVRRPTHGVPEQRGVTSDGEPFGGPAGRRTRT